MRTRESKGGRGHEGGGGTGEGVEVEASLGKREDMGEEVKAGFR